MIILGVVLYLFIGALVFLVMRSVEEKEKSYASNAEDWYKDFCKKPKYYRILVRSFVLLIWPVVFIIAMVHLFRLLYQFISLVLRDLIK